MDKRRYIIVHPVDSSADQQTAGRAVEREREIMRKKAESAIGEMLRMNGPLVIQWNESEKRQDSHNVILLKIEILITSEEIIRFPAEPVTIGADGT